MLLRNRRDSNQQLQVADSVRYREAVSRLKRILYNRPSTFEYSRSVSPIKERKMFTESFQNRDDFENHLPDKSIEDTQKSFSSLFDMIKKQDDLIAQLEKENLFLKTELVTTAEASKEIALQNESFRKRLTDTLLQMETSPDISSLSEGNDQTEEVINCLKDERERLVECIKLQEETISALRRRETEAIDKVKQAVSLAEDSQHLTDKVRESGDENRKDLQHQLEDAFDKIQTLQQQLHKAHEREKSSERLLRDHEKSLSRLEEDTRDKDTSLKKRELDYQNQIEEGKRALKEAEDGNERLEKVLQEQRNTSEATFKRLEALLDRRNMETESYTRRRKSLEKQIVDQKQENQRLIQAINDLAKERSYNTDDVKYATQISNSLPLEINTKHEINEIKATVQEHQDSISQLQEEVNAVRHEMTQEMEGLRNNIGELFSTIYKEEANTPRPISPYLPKAIDSLENKVSSKAEIIPDSSHSEGYDTLKEYPEIEATPTPMYVSHEQYIPYEEKEKEIDKSTKILTIPYSRERKSESQKRDVDLDEKHIDKSEDDTAVSFDGIERDIYSNENISEIRKNSIQEMNEKYLENETNDNMNVNYEAGEVDEDLKDQIIPEEVTDREISKKEIRANSEEEKEKDESAEDESQEHYDNLKGTNDENEHVKEEIQGEIKMTQSDSESKLTCSNEDIENIEEIEKISDQIIDQEGQEDSVTKVDEPSVAVDDNKDDVSISKEEDEDLSKNKDPTKNLTAEVETEDDEKNIKISEDQEIDDESSIKEKSDEKLNENEPDCKEEESENQEDNKEIEKLTNEKSDVEPGQDSSSVKDTKENTDIDEDGTEETKAFEPDCTDADNLEGDAEIQRKEETDLTKENQELPDDEKTQNNSEEKVDDDDDERTTDE